MITIIGPYYVGQIPARTLAITVEQQNGEAEDLSNYTAASLVVYDAAGNLVVNQAANIAIAAEGLVNFTWPTESPFATPGDYKYQLRLSNDVHLDLTSVGSFEVYKGLGD